MANQLIPVAFYSRENNSGTYTSAGASDVSGTCSQVFKIGFNCSAIKVVYSNYTAQTPESANFSDLSLQTFIQTTADVGTPAQVNFGGGLGVIVKGGHELVSDSFVGTFTAGQYIAIRTYASWPSLGTFPLLPLTNSSAITGSTATTGNNYVHNGGNGSIQAQTAGASSAWTSSNNTPGFGAIMILGYASDGVLRGVVGLAGDSIQNGSNEQGDGTGGAAVRALTSLSIPYVTLANAGEKVYGVKDGSGYSFRYRRALDAGVTVWVSEYGTNDAEISGDSYAAIKANSLTYWAHLAQNGAAIIPVTLLPRSSGTFATNAGQTVSTHLATFQSFNAYLRAPVSSGAGNSARFDAAALNINMPYIIDAASYVETDALNSTPGGPSAPLTSGKWYTGAGNNTAYTNDGTHPSANGVTLMVPAFTGAQAAILATAPASPSGGLRFARRL